MFKWLCDWWNTQQRIEKLEKEMGQLVDAVNEINTRLDRISYH